MRWYSILSPMVFIIVAATTVVGRAQQTSPPGGNTQPELQSRQRDEPPLQDEPVRLQWKLEPGRRLYQELVVTQKSSCQVQGINVTTGLKYLVLSSFFVEDIASDGTATIRQKIESARLLEADATAQAVFGDLLRDLAGRTFRLTFSPRMEIESLDTGEDALPVVAGGNPLNGQPLMMASLVDRDGWRELNQLTFYQPDRTLKADDRWQQPVTHSWGPLGSWSGHAEYKYQGERDDLAQVAYQLKLAHQAPDPSAASSLPFRPTDATFQTEKASGIILFDRRRGRVEQAAETFHVVGSMAIELLGQKLSIGIREQQDFRLRIYENRLGL